MRDFVFFLWLMFVLVCRFVCGMIIGIGGGGGVGYDNGLECGVIISKMNILTDNGTGEYRRLSDKYELLNCRYLGEKDIVSYIREM